MQRAKVSFSEAKIQALKRIAAEEMTKVKTTLQATASGSREDTEEESMNNKDTTANVVVYGVPTHNPFGKLDTEEDKMDAEVTTPPKTTPKPPPIVVSGTYNYKVFASQIKKVIGSDNFRLQFQKDTIKVFTNADSDHNKVREELIKENIPFHTYTKRNERTKKLVMKAAPDMDPSEIKEDLERKNIPVKSVTKLNSKSRNSYSYLVTTDKGANLKNIKNEVRDVQNLKIKWERYSRDRNYTQCFKCQRFGHNQSNCNYPPNCVKCAGNHNSRDCTLVKTDTSKPKCINCGEEHTASYRQCPALLQYLQEKQQAQTNRPQKTREPIATKRVPLNNVQPILSGRSFAEAVRAPTTTPGNTDLQELTQELHTLNSLVNIRELIGMFRDLNNKLKASADPAERKIIALQYLMAVHG